MAEVVVYPGAPRATHELSLSDGVETWGLTLDHGPRGIQEIPQTPSTLRFTGGGTKFGDYEPGMSHIEMRTWQGGRGLEELADDPSRYFDSRDAWTLTPARLLPSLKPQYVQRDGHITSSLSADVEWKPLLSGQRFLATSFVPVSDYNASRAYLWLRRRGYPGIVTCTLRSDSAGAPGTVLKTATW